VFLVVPHIVRTQSLDRANLRTIDTGVGANVELRHVSAAVPEGSAAAPNGAAPVHSSSDTRPSLGVVPGQSAIAAAPAALAQMSASADANGQSANAAVTPPPVDSPPAAGTPASVQPPGPGAPPGTGAPPGIGGPPGPARPGNVNLMFSPPGSPVAAGTTFQVPVVLTGGRDIASVPMQIQYDPSKLSLVNVTSGDLLGRDNQAVALIHRDDGPGNITINAARPPGVAGVNGAGVICVLSFQAKTAGESTLSLSRGGAINSAQQQSPATPSQVKIAVH
jgi:general secretion pathway protein D